MTTIDENEEKNNDESCLSESNSINENVVISHPFGGKQFYNVFVNKNRIMERCRTKKKDDILNMKKSITNKNDQTEKTTIENEFNLKCFNRESSKNIVFEENLGYIIKRKEKKLCSIKINSNKNTIDAEKLEIGINNNTHEKTVKKKEQVDKMEKLAERYASEPVREIKENSRCMIY